MAANFPRGDGVAPQPRTPPIVAAATAGDADEVRRLVREGIGGINERSGPMGATALVSAAIASRAEVLAALVEAGADVDVPCNDGSTALMWAAYRRLDAGVRLLLEAGASVDAVSGTGGDRRRTVLSLAETCAMTDELLPLCSREMIRGAHSGDIEVARNAPIRLWLAGSHAVQQARREAERVLLAASPEMPREMASLCGEYLHRGRLAADPPGGGGP